MASPTPERRAYLRDWVFRLTSDDPSVKELLELFAKLDALESALGHATLRADRAEEVYSYLYDKAKAELAVLRRDKERLDFASRRWMLCSCRDPLGPEAFRSAIDAAMNGGTS